MSSGLMKAGTGTGAFRDLAFYQHHLLTIKSNMDCHINSTTISRYQEVRGLFILAQGF